MIEDIDTRRAELLRERNSVVSWLTGRIQETEDYEERKALYDELGKTGRADPSEARMKEV